MNSGTSVNATPASRVTTIQPSARGEHRREMERCRRGDDAMDWCKAVSGRRSVAGNGTSVSSDAPVFGLDLGGLAFEQYVLVEQVTRLSCLCLERLDGRRGSRVPHCAAEQCLVRGGFAPAWKLLSNLWRGAEREDVKRGAWRVKHEVSRVSVRL